MSDSTGLRDLGWDSSTPLERVIREYVEWAQAQPEVPYQSYAAASLVMKQTEVVRTVK